MNHPAAIAVILFYPRCRISIRSALLTCPLRSQVVIFASSHSANRRCRGDECCVAAGVVPRGFRFADCSCSAAARARRAAAASRLHCSPRHHRHRRFFPSVKFAKVPLAEARGRQSDFASCRSRTRFRSRTYRMAGKILQRAPLTSNICRRVQNGAHVYRSTWTIDSSRWTRRK